MKALTSTLLLAVLVACAACDDDEVVATGMTSDLTVEFEGVVGDAPLALEAETYDAAGVAEGFRISRLSFFVSDVELLSETADGELGTDVADIGYVDVGLDGTGELSLSGVPNGEYVGLRFNLGLTDEQDALQPADFAVGHPLSEPAEYWVDWGSYIFLKVEGRADTLADGNARFDQGFVYHVGKAAEYTRRLDIRMPISVAGGASATGITVDVETLLGLRSAEPLSLTGAADHRNTAAERIMANAGSAFRRRD